MTKLVKYVLVGGALAAVVYYFAKSTGKNATGTDKPSALSLFDDALAFVRSKVSTGGDTSSSPNATQGDGSSPLETNTAAWQSQGDAAMSDGQAVARLGGRQLQPTASMSTEVSDAYMGPSYS